MSWFMRTWRRVFGCGTCHRTGVIMTGVCDCGWRSWSLSPHDAWCDASPCPHGCKLAGSRADAVKVWRPYWKEAQAT